MTSPDASGPTDEQLARVAALRAQRQGAVESERSSEAATDDQQARLAALRAKRQSPAATRPTGSQRKRHVAMGARIAAAGIGASGALGIVAAFGVASAAPDEVAGEAEDTAEQGSLIIVVHDGDQVYEVEPAQSAQTPVVEATAGMETSGLDDADRDYDLLFAALDAVPTPTPIYLAANPIVETIRLPGETIYVEIEVPAPAAAASMGQSSVESVSSTISEPDPSLYEQAPAADAAAPQRQAVVIAAAPQPAPPIVAPAPAPAPEPAPAPKPEPAPSPPKTRGS